MQIAGYHPGHGIGEHHDLIGKFSKSMLIGCNDTIMFHFGMRGAKKPIQSLAVLFPRKAALTIEKDSLSDIIYKHGIYKHDVKNKRISYVLRVIESSELKFFKPK